MQLTGAIACQGPDLFQSSSGQKAGCNRVYDSELSPAAVFQSSSGQKAGCNPGGRGLPRGGACFNPHPARRPDATRVPAEERRPRLVSILIRPEGRMQLRRHRVLGAFKPVSILIRPEGRMQPGWWCRLLASTQVSILIRPEGRMQPGWWCRLLASTQVSILIRPEGRMQRRCGRCRHRCPPGFNPHPARRPDATMTPGRKGFER